LSAEKSAAAPWRRGFRLGGAPGNSGKAKRDETVVVAAPTWRLGRSWGQLAKRAGAEKCAFV
jgi:hypothetical protein